MLEECWLAAKELEQYLLRRWVARTCSVEDGRTIVCV